MQTQFRSLQTPVIQWQRRSSLNTLPLPRYQSDGAAGFDLQAYLDGGGLQSSYDLQPQERCLIHTGFNVAVPDGYELQIRPRSGLAIRDQIIILNSPGTIDADYRGEIVIGLKNLSRVVFTITHGMRIAQAVLAPVKRADHVEVEQLDETARGTGALGSTGV